MYYPLNADANISIGASFGEGTGPIYGTNIACSGEEDSITDCNYSMDVSSCVHANDAGVSCSEACEQLCITTIKGKWSFHC